MDAAPKIPGFTRASRPLPMPKASPKTDLPNEPASYELALEELEQLVGRIESGQMPLDQMLAGYQRGAALLAFCRKRLDAVQDQIKVLDEGSLWTKAVCKRGGKNECRHDSCISDRLGFERVEQAPPGPCGRRAVPLGGH